MERVIPASTMQSQYKEIVIESDNPRHHRHRRQCQGLGRNVQDVDGSWWSSTLDYMQIRAEHNPHQCPHRIQSTAASASSASAMALLFPYHLTNPQQHCHYPRLISSHRDETRDTRDTSVANTRDCAGDTGESSAFHNKGGGVGVERVLGATATAIVKSHQQEVAVDKKPWEEEDKDQEEAKRTTVKHNCLVIRRQIVSNGIPLIPLLFLLLLVTTSALPPVIRIGKWCRFIRGSLMIVLVFAKRNRIKELRISSHTFIQFRYTACVPHH